MGCCCCEWPPRTSIVLKFDLMRFSCVSPTSTLLPAYSLCFEVISWVFVIVALSHSCMGALRFFVVVCNIKKRMVVSKCVATKKKLKAFRGWKFEMTFLSK